MNWLIRFYLRNDLEKWKPVAYIAALIFVVLLVSSCGARVEKTDVDQIDTNKFEYVRDNRTDLCFAVASYSKIATNLHTSYGLSMTNVPCTPAVMKLIR